ncbi:DNA-binding protein [Streptomyces sp. NPDC056632]|uniref:DNA-binding protein n=1 Tax=Streptomyces sp. NPDC056632 TaxID=3345884 RepID=UPI00369D843D
MEATALRGYRHLPLEDVMPAAALALPTLDEVRNWPATVDVRRAALALGISRSQLYALIQRDEAPIRVLDFGAKRVVTASLVRLLEAV